MYINKQNAWLNIMQYAVSFMKIEKSSYVILTWWIQAFQALSVGLPSPFPLYDRSCPVDLLSSLVSIVERVNRNGSNTETVHFNRVQNCEKKFFLCTGTAKHVQNKVYTCQTASSSIMLCVVGGSFCFSYLTFSQKWSIIQWNKFFVIML